jgi:hypothetical protein
VDETLNRTFSPGLRKWIGVVEYFAVAGNHHPFIRSPAKGTGKLAISTYPERFSRCVKSAGAKKDTPPISLAEKNVFHVPPAFWEILSFFDKL